MSRIEKLSHFCVIALSLTATALLIDRRFVPRTPPKRAGVSETAFLGKSIGIPLPLAERTRVVVAMTTQCAYCIKSLPLYRRLSDIASKGVSVSPQPVSPQPALVVLSPEPENDMKAFLSEYSIRPDAVVKVGFEAIHVTATPGTFRC